MEKERFLVEVTVRGEKGWKAIHMCARRGARVWRIDGWKGAKITWQSILAK